MFAKYMQVRLSCGAADKREPELRPTQRGIKMPTRMNVAPEPSGGGIFDSERCELVSLRHVGLVTTASAVSWQIGASAGTIDMMLGKMRKLRLSGFFC